MNSVISQIQADDPSFDPVGRACARAQVPRTTFTAALDRVYIDGYYGPVSDAEWQEQDGREPSNVSEALSVLSKVCWDIEDYVETFIGIDEDGFEFEVDESTCDADEIRREVFASIITIYGHLPW